MDHPAVLQSLILVRSEPTQAEHLTTRVSKLLQSRMLFEGKAGAHPVGDTTYIDQIKVNEHFEPSLIFESKARAYPTASYSIGRLLALPTYW